MGDVESEGDKVIAIFMHDLYRSAIVLDAEAVELLTD